MWFPCRGSGVLPGDAHTWPASTAQDEGAEWFVAFFPVRVAHWWNWLAVGKWKHCNCFRYNVPLGCWEIYSFDVSGLEVLHIGGVRLSWLVEQWTGEGAEIWSIGQGREMRPFGNLLMNCVGMVKALVRQGGGALRPSSLYRQLRKSGAKRAWESVDGHEGQGSGA